MDALHAGSLVAETAETSRPTRHGMPLSDRLVEQFYDLMNGIADEYARREVARIALLAAQHRAALLSKRRPRA